MYVRKEFRQRKNREYILSTSQEKQQHICSIRILAFPVTSVTNAAFNANGITREDGLWPQNDGVLFGNCLFTPPSTPTTSPTSSPTSTPTFLPTVPSCESLPRSAFESIASTPQSRQILACTDCVAEVKLSFGFP